MFSYTELTFTFTLSAPCNRLMPSPSICPILTSELLSVVSRIQPEGDAACGIAHLVHEDVYIVGVEGAPGLHIVFEFFDCHTRFNNCFYGITSVHYYFSAKVITISHAAAN